VDEVRRVLVLGSTGSIGTAALDVARSLDKTLRVVGLAANTRWRELAAQIRAFGAARAAIADAGAGAPLRAALDGCDATVFDGPGAVERLVEETEADVVLVAVVGGAALGPALAAIRKGVPILALANKESVVMAGHILMAEAERHGVQIVPVDSEHSAVFQAMKAGERGDVARVILTASGGPFRGKPPASLHHVTPEQALDHPTWKMGAKVTIDSATLMNKALEIVEARWLFGLDASQIDVVIHPESIVHSFVEFCDGTLLAQMGCPDMRSPIQFALTYPRRLAGRAERLDPATAGLSFEPADEGLYPALALGRRVAAEGGTTGAVLSAANEVAGRGFLQRRIRLPDICRIVRTVLDRHEPVADPDLDAVLAADRWARETAERCME
jgi:1-deoxy-D-xylulose-5-phosphate reductoisomerase